MGHTKVSSAGPELEGGHGRWMNKGCWIKPVQKRMWVGISRSQQHEQKYKISCLQVGSQQFRPADSKWSEEKFSQILLLHILSVALIRIPEITLGLMMNIFPSGIPTLRQLISSVSRFPKPAQNGLQSEGNNALIS